MAVHTSTISVSIMPIREVKKVVIPESDIEIETSRSGGAGGQNVNKVETAVHYNTQITGIAVRCTISAASSKSRACHGDAPGKTRSDGSRE